jgi:hypothetical protein
MPPAMRPFAVHGTFEATDIEDAINYLAQHFAHALNEEPSPDEDVRLCDVQVYGA